MDPTLLAFILMVIAGGGLFAMKLLAGVQSLLR
jgi:hypothetical protein